ncbi:MAG: bifunctional 5,10-methylenetetrahydrofolate dehydrogenase/5,10-methenyltetrahydrofolate cyclohydrolase [Candidatus Saccharibacteria bacterium]|nr:bifunctional 5,10-methylenetetrahydrofolate dehydrogenase/5,10-methenyltetrahydrofolate cyclohydrolase [Candidatus Saccharibacteria bacterium]
MTKILNGSELAGFIKERQAKQVRALRQTWKVFPHLTIVQMGEHSVINKYAELKSAYGEDILIDVDILDTTADDILEQIEKLNRNDNVHGIIVQLPLADATLTSDALNAVEPAKDVDGLGDKSAYIPATATAVDWLLNGYNIDLNDKKIAIVGKGKLIGAPLARLWINAGYNVSICDTKTPDLTKALIGMDIIVTAAGVPGLIKSEMIRSGAVVVDAGTASQDGKIVGDIADGVRQRSNLTITPIFGGVGPLTVAALFDSVIIAAQKVANKKGKQDI